MDRGAVDANIVDRAWLATRPQFRWSVDLASIKRRMGDADFVRLADDAARAVLGRQADALTLFRLALVFHIGYDVEVMKHQIHAQISERNKPRRELHGKVVEATTGQPIADARVFSSDAVSRTDGAGVFGLKTSVPQREGMIWIEARGYATAEYPALDGAPAPQDVRVELVREQPFVGRVVGSSYKPVAGAKIQIWVDHHDFRVPRPTSIAKNDHFAFPLEVRSNDEGVFAVDGLPPGPVVKRCIVAHPSYQTHEVAKSLLEGRLLPVVKLEPGCNVSGFVVDEQGRPVGNALVLIRKPEDHDTELSTETAADGRFHIGAARPGRWIVIIQPKQQAPLFGAIVAAQKRPVDNQYVVGPAAYIGGKVVDPEGKPLADAAIGWVEPVDERGYAVSKLELGRMTFSADDGTFRIGPLAPGEYSLTGVIEGPRRLGRVKGRSNQTNTVIRLEVSP